MRAIFKVVFGGNETHVIFHNSENVKLESTEILVIRSSAPFHKKIFVRISEYSLQLTVRIILYPIPFDRP